MKVEYNNLYTHFVFTTSHRQPIIKEEIRDRLEKFITGVVKNYACKIYAIYANPDHMHMLISRSPNISELYIADIIAESSTKFINDTNLLETKFSWQDSASAFSVSKRHVEKVCQYILNQKEHHKKITFAQEYERFIKFYEKTINPYPK